MTMRPASGRTSPSRGRRKTDLPPPLRPMMIVIEPSGTSRSTPRSTAWRPNDLVRPSTLIIEGWVSRQHRAQEVVPHQDEHGGEHDGLGGGPRHAFGAVTHVESLVGADPGDQDAERHRLPEAEHDVLHVDERLHLAEVGALG